MAKKVSHSEPSGAHIGRRHSISRLKIYLITAVLIIVFLPSFVKYQALSYKSRKMEERIRALNAENRQLEEEKRRLETDITYVEKRAREEMGIARKGEIVLKEVSVKK